MLKEDLHTKVQLYDVIHMKFKKRQTNLWLKNVNMWSALRGYNRDYLGRGTKEHFRMMVTFFILIEVWVTRCRYLLAKIQLLYT